MSKKIIVANYRYFVPGGPEVYMFKFMNEIEKYGYEPIPFSVKNSKNVETPYSKYFINNRYKDSIYFKDIKITPKSIFRILKGAYYNYEAQRKLKKLIKKEKPVALFALQVINTLSPSIFKTAKRMGLTVIHRISDFNLICPNSKLLNNDQICTKCISGEFENAIKNKCFHSNIACKIRVNSMKYHRKHNVYDYVDFFMTPTDFTRDLLIQGGFSKDKIITIPTFINAKTVIPDYNHHEYFLFLGRIAPEKGLIYAIEAISYMKEKNVKLKVTGEINEIDGRIIKFIDENNIREKIDFVGFKRGKDLDELISHSIAILCPAIWYENMPNTVLEAYAHGKPVVASNIGCFPMLIKNGKNGLLFEAANSKELAEKCNMLLNDSSLIKNIGEINRQESLNEYSSDKHFNSFIKLLNK